MKVFGVTLIAIIISVIILGGIFYYAARTARNSLTETINASIASSTGKTAATAPAGSPPNQQSGKSTIGAGVDTTSSVPSGFHGPSGPPTIVGPSGPPPSD